MIRAKAKSTFIYPAVASCLLAFVAAVFMALTRDADSLAWWGAALAALPLPAAWLRLAVRKPPRASENAPLALLVASAGTFLAAWEMLFERVAGWQPLALASFTLLLLLLYVFWYSRFGRIASPRLDVGSKLPEFTLTAVDGTAAHSTDLLGRPAVLLFYRGNWCPLCMAQVAEIAARYRDFEELDIQVALISPQAEERSRALAERYAVPFHFWVDQGNRVAAALDIAVRHGVPAGTGGDYHPDTVMPTVIVTNANGTIVFSDQTDNYRLRPEPDIFLAIVRRAGAFR